MISRIRRTIIRSVTGFTAIAALAVSPLAAADDAQQADETELRAMLHDFLANSSTEAAHARFWADDLVYTSSNGTRFGKSDIMEGFAMDAEDEPTESTEDPEEEQGPTLVYTGEDVKVQLYGTTAIVTFRLVGTPDDGSAKDEYFNSGTFLKRGGEWRVVSWQATIIPSES